MQRIFYDNHHDICRLSKRIFPRTEAPMADLARCGQGLVRSQNCCRREPQAGSLPGSSAPQHSRRVAAGGLRCISRGGHACGHLVPCHAWLLQLPGHLYHPAGALCRKRSGEEEGLEQAAKRPQSGDWHAAMQAQALAQQAAAQQAQWQQQAQQAAMQQAPSPHGFAC